MAILYGLARKGYLGYKKWGQLRERRQQALGGIDGVLNKAFAKPIDKLGQSAIGGSMVSKLLLLQGVLFSELMGAAGLNLSHSYYFNVTPRRHARQDMALIMMKSYKDGKRTFNLPEIANRLNNPYTGQVVADIAFRRGIEVIDIEDYPGNPNIQGLLRQLVDGDIELSPSGTTRIDLDTGFVRNRTLYKFASQFAECTVQGETLKVSIHSRGN